MKTFYISCVFLLMITMVCCQSTVKEKKENISILTKQEQLELLYTTKVIPLFSAYSSVEIPTEFTVEEKDTTINARASFGYVEVSQGLINSDKETIQFFVLAHEVSHIVTILQAVTFGLGDEIPAGLTMNPYQKAELLADLTGLHLISMHQPTMRIVLESEFNFLKSVLGIGTFTHPSGDKRIKLFQEYYKKASLSTANDVYNEMFTEIWND